jgi:chromosome segregation ATPase
MKYAIECSIEDTNRLLSEVERADEIITDIYTSPTDGKLAEIVKLFGENLNELREEAGDSYYTIANDISDANRAISANRSEIEKLKLEIMDCRRQIDKLSEAASSLNTKIAAVSARRAMIVGDSEAAENARSACDSAIARANERLREIERDKEALRRHIAELEAAIRRIEDMIYNLEIIISNAEKSRSAIESTVSRCESIFANIEGMLSDVGKVYAEYRIQNSSVTSRASEARAIIERLNGYFFKMNDRTILDSDRITLASSSYFKDMARSFTAARESFRDTGARLFDSSSELKATIQDEVINDAAAYLAELDAFLNEAATEFGDKGDIFRKCATLVDSYTSLS